LKFEELSPRGGNIEGILDNGDVTIFQLGWEQFPSIGYFS
jgi:hypothetical protein